MRPRRWWLLFIPAFLLVWPCLWWIFVVRGPQPCELQVPMAFSGWATLKYGVPGAPALKAGPDGTRLIPFPASGVLETSDPLPKGGYAPRWYRSDRGGAVLMRWDPAPGTVREVWTARCFQVFVPGASPEPGAPPALGCDG